MDQQSIDTLPLLLEHSEQSIALFDATDKLRYANPAFRAMMALAADDFPTWAELMRMCHARRKGSRIETTDFEAWLASARGRRGKLPFRANEADMHDGRWMHVSETTLPGGWMLCIFADITNLATGHRKLRVQRDLALRASMTDELTGLANRRFLMDKLRSSLPDAEVLTIAELDLDRFKHVNDRYGHEVGDVILRDFAFQLQDHIRRDDVAGRFGGEEFLLIFPGLQARAAKTVIERLLDAVRKSVPLKHLPDFRYSFSAGIAQSEPGEGSESLLRRADQSLYEAKSQGRNRYVIHAGAAPASKPAA